MLIKHDQPLTSSNKPLLRYPVDSTFDLPRPMTHKGAHIFKSYNDYFNYIVLKPGTVMDNIYNDDLRAKLRRTRLERSRLGTGLNSPTVFFFSSECACMHVTPKCIYHSQFPNSMISWQRGVLACVINFHCTMRGHLYPCDPLIVETCKR